MTKENTREHFKSKIGFMLAAIGSAIGLGLLWKFPYVIGQNGGGLFLLTYFFCIFFAGIPLFIGEIILGRTTQSAAIQSFEKGCKKGKSMFSAGGYLGVLSSFLIMSFYSVIAGWGLSYILLSLLGYSSRKDITEVGMIFERLSGSASITLLWHGVFTLITMAIVIAGVQKGIEYWSKIMVRILLVKLFGLFLYSTTLPGFYQAVEFIFIPVKGSFTFSSVLEALGLAFMTLSVGQGIMISYGSYVRSGDNIIKMSLIVAFSVVVVAILAALTIFPVVFTFGFSPSEGPSLIFKTLPVLFSRLPGGIVVSTIFFSLFVFTALTSAVPLVEVVATNLMEKFGWERKKATMYVCLATFLFGIPSALSGCKNDFIVGWNGIFGMNFLDTIDFLASSWVIPLAGLFTALFIGYRMDRKNLEKEFYEGAELKIGFNIWYFAVRFVVPIVVLLIILQTTGMIDLSII